MDFEVRRLGGDRRAANDAAEDIACALLRVLGAKFGVGFVGAVRDEIANDASRHEAVGSIERATAIRNGTLQKPIWKEFGLPDRSLVMTGRRHAGGPLPRLLPRSGVKGGGFMPSRYAWHGGGESGSGGYRSKRSS